MANKAEEAARRRQGEKKGIETVCYVYILAGKFPFVFELRENESCANISKS